MYHPLRIASLSDSELRTITETLNEKENVPCNGHSSESINPEAVHGSRFGTKFRQNQIKADVHVVGNTIFVM